MNDARLKGPLKIPTFKSNLKEDGPASKFHFSSKASREREEKELKEEKKRKRNIETLGERINKSVRQKRRRETLPDVILQIGFRFRFRSTERGQARALGPASQFFCGSQSQKMAAPSPSSIRGE